MTADADPPPAGRRERWSGIRRSPWFAVAVGVVLLGAAYAALRTGLASTAMGGFAPGAAPDPRPHGFVTVVLLLIGAGLSWGATMRRVAAAGLAAAAALSAAIATRDLVVVAWVAAGIAGVGVGAAAVAFRWHARSVHWRRRRAALVAIALGVATCLATGDILAVLALVVVLPVAAMAAAVLLEGDDH